MSLSVSIRHALGDFTLDAAFDLDDGIGVLFGPSGGGKTTIVQAVAGLLRPAQARIVLDGESLTDTDSRLFVPPHRRRIGYVFQDARLFPHYSVRGNLLYGAPGGKAAAFDEVVDLLGLRHLLKRRPRHLSGGEKARVALGRALLSAPRLVLMDEPLAALDAPRRAEILAYVEKLRDAFAIPVLYITHSIDEALRLASKLILVEGGRVTAAGPPGELSSRLDLDVLARREDAGAVLDATVEEWDPVFGLALLATPVGPLRLPGEDLRPGRSLRLRILARDITLSLDPPGRQSALNVLSGTIVEVEPRDREVDVAIACGDGRVIARITRLSAELLHLRPGLQVFAMVKSVALDRAAALSAGA